DLALLLVGERQLEEVRDRLRILRVAMRIVRREDELVASELLDRIPRRSFVWLNGYPALAAEILAGRRLEVLHEDVALELVVLVEPPDQPGDPGAIGFEKGDLELWMPRQDAAAQKGAEAEHLLDGLRVNAANPKVRIEVV